MEDMIKTYMKGWNISREKAVEILKKSGYFNVPSQEYLEQEAAIQGKELEMEEIRHLLNDLIFDVIKETQSKFPPAVKPDFAEEIVAFKNKKLDECIEKIKEII